jgi:predicted anti-sigma-YlaC factor YlaD
MFRKHIVGQLSAYNDGELSAAENRRVEMHLQLCPKCRAAYDQIRFGVRLASVLSPWNAPDSTWSELHRIAPELARRRWIPQTVLAAAFVTVALLIFLVTRPAVRAPSWEVTGFAGMSRLRAGEVLQTDSSSEARIKIANIGQLTVDPNTRIRLLVTQADQHRIALYRGSVEATTWAPPRLFVVETPAATAVDLGCKYTLKVEDDGSSLLHVTLGLVALERNDRETVVPAGAFCRTRAGTGPGTPFFEDSSAQLQSALDQVDSLPEGSERTRQLEIVLRESHIRDAVSLWHLIPRLDADSRGLIYDRLAELLPPPAGVPRDAIIRLDPKALDAWKKVVSQLWQ